MIAILWRAGAGPIVPAQAKRPSSPRQGLGPFPREGGILTPRAAYGLTPAGPGDGGGGPWRYVEGLRRSRAPSHCRYALGRALLGRRHADRRLGVDEELPAEGRLGLTAGAGPQRRAQLPQGEALEREPWLDHRPRRAALPQGRRPREPTVLHGPRPDGEPQRPCGRCRAHARDRDGGTILD